MPDQTTILIGDVHGCSSELNRLLEKVSPTRGEQIVFLGDLTNKGPDPRGVFRIVQSLSCICLRGNHDNGHLKWREGILSPNKEMRETRKLMGERDYEAYVDMVLRMPLFYENERLIAVHAALRSDLILSLQPADLLLGEIPIDKGWKDNFRMDRPVVVGHKRYGRVPEEPYIAPGRFYGIDTGCVYGGALTALALPSGKIWQTKAKKTYA